MVFGSTRRGRRARETRAIVACLALWVTGCSATDGEASREVQDGLRVTPLSETLLVGDTLALTVAGDGALPEEHDWSSLDPDIAHVDARGRVVGRAAGIGAISVARGSQRGWAIVRVVSSPDRVDTPVLTREDGRFLLNGNPILPFGLRAANALQTDDIATRFIDGMEGMLEHGMQSFSLTIQGGRHTHGGNSAFNGYNPDGTLKLEYARRLARLLEEAGARQMVPVVVAFYRGRDQELVDEDAVRDAVRQTVTFLRPWRHVWINLINEPNHGGYDHRILGTPEGQVALYELAKAIDRERIVYVSHEPGANDGFLSDSWGRLREVSPPADGDVMIEYARGWSEGRYDSFREPGVFPAGWAEMAMRDAEAAFRRGGYWFFLACWHQKADAAGWPRFDKGGVGTAEDPGVAPVWDRMRALGSSSAGGME